MLSLYRLLQSITRAGVWVFGAGYLLIALLTTVDVVLRNTTGGAIIGVQEVSGYVFAVATTWGFSYCLFQRSHVRIDAAYQRLSLRPRAWLDLVAMLALAGYVAMLTYRAWGTLQDTLLFQAVSRTSLQTPLWIPQSLWVAGLVLFLANLVFLSLYILLLLARGDHAGVQALAGIPHVTDEIAEET